jgi:hypothetical protein
MRIQCTCGEICRSRTVFKIHCRTTPVDGLHTQNRLIRRFRPAGPNKVDRRKERELQERERNELRRFT